MRWRILSRLVLALWFAPPAALAQIVIPHDPPLPPGWPKPASHQSCPYPLAATVTGAQGKTQIAFVIGKDGRTRALTLRRTSGNADLDKAARACVAASRYEPTLKNGKPVERNWIVEYVWRIDDADRYLPEGISGAADCKPYYQGPYPRVRADYVTARLSYRIAADRTLSDPRVLKSSGMAALDRASIRCTQGLRPVLRPSDRKRHDGAWRIDVEWPSGLPPKLSDCSLPHICIP